jgi:endonuclease G
MPRRSSRSDGFGQPDIAQVVDSSVSAFARLNKRTQLILVVALLFAGAICLVVYFHSQGYFSQSVTTSNMLLGNPSNAGSWDRNNYLLVKPYFVVSYNDQKGIPNWVSWEVTEADLGDAPRKQVFDPDETLAAGFHVVKSGDYSGSGFDRGHMCPHSDRAANQNMSCFTFLCINVIQKLPKVNEKAWAQLDDYCRQLVRRHNHLYIVSGPLGQGGTGSRGFKEYTPRGNVVIPAECWKIIVIVPDEGGGDDLAKISSGTRVIAVEMPNDQGVVGDQWDIYRTTVATIEQKTGYHFLDKLRPDLAAALRQKLDDIPIPPPRPLRHEQNGIAALRITAAD